ncbi:hypothetical protein [Pseudomonas sp. BAY1663]|uniref:hypothetical protein n=1 Tax=Pseudomonas sp. BAY1663 TaxID=1439940 RepID=UPI003529828D
MEQTESVSDVLCDVCGDSTRVEGYGLQFGTLQASWGYGSAHDGERYEVHLCEPCFFRTISGLKRERMVNFMFSGEEQEISDFGRVARDDFSMTGVARPPDFVVAQHPEPGGSLPLNCDIAFLG